MTDILNEAQKYLEYSLRLANDVTDDVNFGSDTSKAQVHIEMLWEFLTLLKKELDGIEQRSFIELRTDINWMEEEKCCE